MAIQGNFKTLVIPAKAGNQPLVILINYGGLVPGFRREDGVIGGVQRKNAPIAAPVLYLASRLLTA